MESATSDTPTQSPRSGRKSNSKGKKRLQKKAKKNPPEPAPLHIGKVGFSGIVDGRFVGAFSNTNSNIRNIL